MKKSRKRITAKRPSKSRQSLGAPPQATQPLAPLPQRQRIHHRLVGALVALGGLLGGAYTVLQVWNGAVPSIAPPAVSGDMSSFAVPFTIENKGPLAFYDVTTVCAIDHMEWANFSSLDGVTLSSMSVSHPQPHGKLPPGRLAEVSCGAIEQMRNITKFHISGDLVSMRAQFTVDYRALFFFKRKFISPHFCWMPTLPSGHQWSICDTLQDTVQH